MVMVMLMPCDRAACPGGMARRRVPPIVAVLCPVENPSTAGLPPSPGLFGATVAPTVTAPVDEVMVCVQPRALPEMVPAEPVKSLTWPDTVQPGDDSRVSDTCTGSR